MVTTLLPKNGTRLLQIQGLEIDFSMFVRPETVYCEYGHDCARVR
jgi:hypothetical protein